MNKLSAVFSFLSRHKFTLFLCVAAAFILFAASLISFGAFDTFHKRIIPFYNWINQHKSLFIFWHLMLLVAIYWYWGFKTEKAAKKYKYSDTLTRRIKNFRWLIIISVLLIDLTAFI